MILIFVDMYLLRTPKIIRKLLPNAMWEMPNDTEDPTVYLTFDDGPNPKATPFVLEQLNKYKAKATFFCIGKNVIEYPGIYNDIIEQGHAVGNHTHDHLKGSKTKSVDYIENVKKATQVIESYLFRPPYGRIKRVQAKTLEKLGYKIVMWSLLSADFDKNISKERCLENVIFNLRPGDIVVYHDSEKAFERMAFSLPKVLEHCKKKSWKLK